MDLNGLNDRQREAVTHIEGPLLVLAGAGSGKTRVVTYRVAHLLRTGVPAESILTLSFTNKAAREVSERVTGLIGQGRTAGLTVCTFHALGLRILRAEAGRIGRDARFTLHGEGEQRAVVREIVKGAGLPLDAPEVHGTISLWKNRGILPNKVRVVPGDTRMAAFRDAYTSYQALLRAHNAVDFDDLLLLPLQVFDDSPDSLRHWQRTFRFILVDEYQDTNPVQYELLRRLTGERGNLCVVGDDDQSIYAWRGAEVGLILRFEEHFPGAKVVLLEENYRSTQTVLEAAHGVVAKIPGRRAKKLWTARSRGDPLGWIDAEDEAAEAEEVANAILAETYRSRRPWRDFAVLYRTNAQARPFEESFRGHSIPHRVLGGSRFFDRKEVRDVLSYLRVMHNPRDAASLMRIANTPKRGLGPQTLLRLQAQAEQQGRSLRGVMTGAEGLSPQATVGVRNLLALLDRYGKRYRVEGLTEDGLAEFIRDSGLRGEVEASYESRRAVERRLELLDEMVASVAAAPRIKGKVDLGLYVEKLALDPPADEEEGDPDAVTLLTLHSAKGLEFPLVFLTGMEEGLLPHGRDPEARASGLEEERRLCYVGMTRAKERLVLSRAHLRRRRGTSTIALPSRFLAEIPLDLTEADGRAPERSEEERQAMAKTFFRGVQDLLS